MRVIGPARAAGDLHSVAAASNNLGRAAADDMNASVNALRETADVATPKAAHHVGVYLRRLKDEPALLFIEL